MVGSSALTAHLEDAYRVACCVLGGDEEDAWAVVTEAYDGAIGFRTRYLENLSPFPTRPRKHRFSEAEAFQFVLYLELEPAEKRAESLSGLPVDLFVLRYVKRVLLKVFEGTPFRTTVAVSGLLYDLKWADISRLYTAITQGEEGSASWTQNDKNDILRSLRQALMTRFGHRLRTHVDGNGSLRIEMCTDASRLFDSVQQSLSLLVLWGQDGVGRQLLVCLTEAIGTPLGNRSFPAMPLLAISVPEGADPALYAAGERETMDAWRARKHAVMDPEILSKIAVLLDLPKLKSRLQLPTYACETPDDEDRDPSVSCEDMKPRPNMYEELFADQAKRRRRRRFLDLSSLRVVVDGEPHGRSLDAGAPFSLSVPTGTDTVSVIGDDDEGSICVGKLYLGLHREEIENSENANIRCERSGAPPITINIARDRADAGSYEITISVQKRSFWSRIHRAASTPVSFPHRTPMLAAAALLLILAVAFVIWMSIPNKGVLQADVPPPATPDQEPSDIFTERRVSNARTPPLPEVGQILDNGEVVDLGQADIGAYGRGASVDAVRGLLTHGAGYPANHDLAFIRINPMGSGSEGSTFSGCPNGVVVRSQRPAFRWKLPSGIANSSGEYEVRILNTDTYDVVASSGIVRGQSWRPSMPLPRSIRYSWEVIVDPRAEPVKLPQKGIVMFRVLNRESEETLEQAEAIRPVSHLVLADLYARAGLFFESEEQLQILARENPDSHDIQTLLRRVSSRSRGGCR